MMSQVLRTIQWVIRFATMAPILARSCGLAIDNNNECILIDSRYACHEIHAHAAGDDIATQRGDSGGPVFRFIGGNLEATGLVSSSTPSKEVPCKYNTPDTCYSDVYYSAIDWDLQEWGATLVP
jgi:hypothetical protein